MMIYARCSLQDAIMLNHAVLGWHVHHHLRNYVVAASPVYIYICCSWNWLESRVAQDAARTWPDAVLNCVINLKCSGGGLWGAKVLYYCIIYKYIAYMTLHIWSRFAVRYHPPPCYGPKTSVLQHSAWKRRICSVFCTVGGGRGPQTCNFVGFLQPAFRKRVIGNVSASTSWGSTVAPPSMSNCHISLNLLI